MKGHTTLLYGLQFLYQFHMMILLQKMCQCLKNSIKKHVERVIEKSDKKYSR